MRSISAALGLVKTSHRRCRGQIQNHAVITDEHTSVVHRWVDSVVIKLGLCPWAHPAEQAGGIRVVTSTALSSEEAFEDLLLEAKRLQNAKDSVLATTLLAYPAVEGWEDFNRFHDFYAVHLKNGSALVKDWGLKVVAFHPGCEAAGTLPQPGDEVAIPGSEDQLLLGVVEDSTSAEEEHCGDVVPVRIEGIILEDFEDIDGSHRFAIQPIPDKETKMVRLSDIVWQLSAEANLDDVAVCRSAIARAPRPVLHLLRMRDLADVDDTKRTAVYEANENTVRTLGLEALDEMIRSCDQ